MATARGVVSRRNLDKLLRLIRKPTVLCVVLVIACVVLVNYRWIVMELLADYVPRVSDPSQWMDDEATEFAITVLTVLLSVSALDLVYVLCFRHLRRVWQRVLRTATFTRLLILLLALLFVQVFVVGYFQAVNLPDRLVRRSRNCTQERCYAKVETFGIDKDIYVFNITDLNQPGMLEMAPPWKVRGLNYTRLRRHLTEDVALSCQLKAELKYHTADQLHLDISWTKDDVKVDTTGQRVSARSTGHTRRGIGCPAPENPRWICVGETLLIQRLREEDFGRYGCHILVTKRQPSRLEDSLKIHINNIAVYEVLRYHDPLEVVIVHTGSEARFIYRVLSDSADRLRIEHRLNGLPRDEPLPKEDIHTRVWPVWEFNISTYHHVKTALLIIPFTACPDGIKACHHYYGEHSFILRRQFYNADIGREDHVEVMLARVLAVPEPLELFPDKYTSDYCLENNNTLVSERCSQKLEELITCLTKKTPSILGPFIIIVIYILPRVYYVWWMRSLINYVLSLTLPEVFRGSVARMVRQDLSSVGLQSPSQERRTVFLAYAETDAELSAYVKSILQSYDLAVYDCQQHVAPGQPPLTAWDQAMDRCSGFVVLITPDYLLQPALVFQLQSIQNLLLEHRVWESDVLLVVAGSCRIPPAVGPLPTIHLLQRPHWELERDLEWWALCFTGEFPNKTVINQVGRDLWRDVCSLLCHCRCRLDDEVAPEPPHFRTMEALGEPEGSHNTGHGKRSDRKGHHPTVVFYVLSTCLKSPSTEGNKHS